MKILTVSIAAYNVEKYLENTLDSICQSGVLDDVEVIIVDDGSKDKTGEIGAKYAKKYPQSIKSVSKENGGHGSTINKGIELSSGKYFRVLDGDDWVNSEGFSKYIEKLKDINTDLVVSNKKLVYPDHEESADFDFLEEKKVYKVSNKYPNNMYTMSTMAIKTELLKNSQVLITEKCFYVDLEYVLYNILLSKTFSYIDEVVYMYRRGMDEQSVSKKSMIRNVDMLSKITLGLYSIIENVDSDIDSKEVAYKSVCKSTGALYRIFLLIEDGNKSKKCLIDFDSKLKEKHLEGFKKIGNDSFIFVARFANYSFFGLLRVAYRKWCKLKKLI